MWKKIGIESFHKTFIHSSVTSVGETSSKLSLVELHLSFHQAIEPNDFPNNFSTNQRRRSPPSVLLQELIKTSSEGPFYLFL